MTSLRVFAESFVITTIGIILALAVYLPTNDHVLTWPGFLTWLHDGRWFGFVLAQITTPAVRTAWERYKVV